MPDPEISSPPAGLRSLPWSCLTPLAYRTPSRNSSPNRWSPPTCAASIRTACSCCPTTSNNRMGRHGRPSRGARDLGKRLVPALRRAKRHRPGDRRDLLRPRHAVGGERREWRMVMARESNHFGAAAFWAQRMAAAGQIGIVMCNASALVPPWQGKEATAGHEPDLHGGAGRRRKAVALDMATTTVAAGKIFKAKINGQPQIPGRLGHGLRRRAHHRYRRRATTDC